VTRSAGLPHSRPLWVATIVTPLLTPLAYFLVLLAVEFTGDHPSPESVFRAIGILYLVGLPLAFGAMCLVGLPLVLLLRSQGMLTPGYVLIGASVIGVLTMSAFTGLMGGAWDPVLTLWGLGLGLFAGFVFCFVAGIPFRETRA
jgi:hypothetical protein